MRGDEEGPTEEKSKSTKSSSSRRGVEKIPSTLVRTRNRGVNILFKDTKVVRAIKNSGLAMLGRWKRKSGRYVS